MGGNQLEGNILSKLSKLTGLKALYVFLTHTSSSAVGA